MPSRNLISPKVVVIASAICCAAGLLYWEKVRGAGQASDWQQTSSPTGNSFAAMPENGDARKLYFDALSRQSRLETYKTVEIRPLPKAGYATRIEYSYSKRAGVINSRTRFSRLFKGHEVGTALIRLSNNSGRWILLGQTAVLDQSPLPEPPNAGLLLQAKVKEQASTSGDGLKFLNHRIETYNGRPTIVVQMYREPIDDSTGIMSSISDDFELNLQKAGAAKSDIARQQTVLARNLSQPSLVEYYIDQQNNVILGEARYDLDGTMFHRKIFADFQVEPAFPADEFVVPETCKVIVAQTRDDVRREILIAGSNARK